jgi:hypothetical protein
MLRPRTTYLVSHGQKEDDSPFTEERIYIMTSSAVIYADLYSKDVSFKMSDEDLKPIFFILQPTVIEILLLVLAFLVSGGFWATNLCH